MTLSTEILDCNWLTIARTTSATSTSVATMRIDLSPAHDTTYRFRVRLRPFRIAARYQLPVELAQEFHLFSGERQAKLLRQIGKIVRLLCRFALLVIQMAFSTFSIASWFRNMQWLSRPCSSTSAAALKSSSARSTQRSVSGFIRASYRSRNRRVKRMTKPSKVLIIGSGPIIIGQAAEFDYAGTQACQALREEGVTSVLVNSNPATIMTDEDIADIVYIEPLTVEVIARIIERERPDGLLPTLGGQTGLNLAVALADAGVLDQYNVRLLGTPLETIRKAEDRELFKDMLRDIGEPVPESATVTTLDEARAWPASIGLPLIIRPAYTLGGTGGGIAHTLDELERIADGGLRGQPHPPGAAGAVPAGLERDRVRGDARRRRQLHHRLQHGEHRPDGRPHRRQHRRRAQPDADRQRVPDAAHAPASRSSAPWASRAAATSSSRWPRPDRELADGDALLRHRGQPPRQPQLGPGLQGHRLPHRPRGGQDRRGQAPGRDPQRRDRQDHGLLRAGPGLRAW